MAPAERAGKGNNSLENIKRRAKLLHSPAELQRQNIKQAAYSGASRVYNFPKSMKEESSTLPGWVLDYCYRHLQGAFPAGMGTAASRGGLQHGGPGKGMCSGDALGSFTSWSWCIPVPYSGTHLQALDLRPLELQPGLQLTDLGLLPAHQRLIHHGLLQEFQLALQTLQLQGKHSLNHNLPGPPLSAWLLPSQWRAPHGNARHPILWVAGLCVLTCAPRLHSGCIPMASQCQCSLPSPAAPASPC